jgi:hypothetical protein
MRPAHITILDITWCIIDQISDIPSKDTVLVEIRVIRLQISVDMSSIFQGHMDSHYLLQAAGIVSYGV